MFGAPIFLTILLLSAGYAAWRGNRDARVIAAACFLATLATRFAVQPLTDRYASVEQGLLLIDGLMLAVFVIVALRSDRFWPLWIAGLQLTSSLGHLLKAIDVSLVPQAYGAAIAFWSYPILLILAVGTWRGHHRLQSHRDGALVRHAA